MELTIEQALQNIMMVIEQFRGTKQEHIALEQSLNKIKDNLCTCKNIKED